MISSHKAEITFFEVILGRRSVRHYQAKRVGKISISSLLEAAVRAPTAMHQEPWAFVIINDKKMLKTLSDIAKPLIIGNAKLTTTERTHHMEELLTILITIFFMMQEHSSLFAEKLMSHFIQLTAGWLLRI